MGSGRSKRPPLVLITLVFLPLWVLASPIRGAWALHRRIKKGWMVPVARVVVAPGDRGVPYARIA